jgi:bifunctional non-homologous end joining protein LigD
VLKEYEEKRHFSRTSEPSPVKSAEGEGPLIFVVQKHAARRLHYDFRLEVDSVLKSWSVPAGPSLDPEIKRLAVMVEDHPLDYASFEGDIPASEYGAGQVIIWDRGDYSPDEDGELFFNDRAQAQERMREGLTSGKLSVFLRGHKLKGSWTLVKMRRRQKDWLLIKHRDDSADSTHDILEKDASDWFFEPKLDGYRIIAAISNGEVRLMSRRGLDVTRKYIEIVRGLNQQPTAQLLLDGEIIALNEQGKLCFQCLQGYLQTMERPDRLGKGVTAVIYYVFDALYLDGYDLRDVPLVTRKELLIRVLKPSKQVRFLDHFEGDGLAIYKSAVEQGLEGVIAKRKNSLYQPGQRSADWLKIKAMQTDDFIIGGYTHGTGNRARTFGALLLGYYDDKHRLLPAGHVGTGFDDRALTSLKTRLDTLRTEQCPFAVAPELNAPATWVRPELVAEIKFSQWTWDGRLRTPVFMRLRDDKLAADVRRTQPAATPATNNLKESPPPRPDDATASILEQLAGTRDSFTVEVEGHRINLTNLDKKLWPHSGERPALTKRHLLTYLVSVAPYLLPHLRDRPLTLSRYPDGIQGEHFFQKHWNNPVPEFVATVQLSEHGTGPGEYLLCNNLATLLWLGQAADLELHTWFSRISPEPDKEPTDKLTPDSLASYPDFIIFDLDPYIYSGSEPRGAEPELNPEGFARTCEAALWLKETLDTLSLSSFVKTSGRTGLHIYVPILRQFDYHAVHSAARTICQSVIQHHRKELTSEWAVERRSTRVFLDYNQNLRGKTLACVYSPRPSPEATVSTPLRWDELGKVYPTDFTILSVPERLSKVNDLWAAILKAKGDLKHLLKLD